MAFEFPPAATRREGKEMGSGIVAVRLGCAATIPLNMPRASWAAKMETASVLEDRPLSRLFADRNASGVWPGGAELGGC